eukprot:TRINITY_DN3409_c0_g1_i1.p1 TRINITY_DN3409_c0_g1~~TRINITY_DN3409_c0_g1_i1.p1  ORF type:complete len:322 (-),score=85.83 TRINITY_DN3409_c0_g1_i1:2562-3527(-)
MAAAVAHLNPTTDNVSFETGHADMIHDVQLDYYGRRLATASSDRLIKVFDVSTGGMQKLIGDITGHDGPVWRVAWAHPKFGSLLASCSYDQKVIIWREDSSQPGVWSKFYEKTFDSSVNSVAWGPPEFGLVLAAGSADSRIGIISHVDNAWHESVFDAHPGGVNSISWGPAVSPNALFSQVAAEVQPMMRMVSGGCDNRVRFWRFENSQWSEEKTSMDDHGGHGNWVRDVSWAPSIGTSNHTVASASEDKSVIIWTEKAPGEWAISERLKFDKKVWRVSWSVMGNILAVSSGENSITLWKESLDGRWKNLSGGEDAKVDEE